MRVVSDTSPLSYLILIGRTDLAAELLGQVVIPSEVRDELSSPAAPAAIRDWVSKLPTWLSVERVPDRPPPHVEEPDLGRLHAGERAAILLAERTGADLLLIDEKAARSVAEKRGLRVTGLLGVVRAGADQGLIDLAEAVDALRRSGFRASRALLERLLGG